jgi:acetyltransferase-like isoleucine patch superfamily enzyme
LFWLLRDVYRKSDSETYIEYLRKSGVLIGKQVKFYNPRTNVVDMTRPYLIEIGDKVKITRGVVILTHGFDWCVLREIYKRPFGSADKVTIGNNVFIGMNVIILKGVSIGNNVIIGAGAVVTSNIQSNSVAVGNPARVVCSLTDYYDKLKSRELCEAAIEAQAISERYGRQPIPDDFKEFFYLFLERDKDKFGNLPVALQVGDYMEEFIKSVPKFSSFDKFLSYCLNGKYYDDI